MSLRFPILLTVVFLSGCSNLGEFVGAKPQEVTVQNALADVGRGLAEFKSINNQSGSNNGLLLDEVTLTLNVTVSRDGSNTLVIDTKNIKPPALSGGEAGLNSTTVRNAKNERSNVMVIKFKNKYTAALNDAGKSGIPNSGGVTFYSIPGQNPNQNIPWLIPNQ